MLTEGDSVGAYYFRLSFPDKNFGPRLGRDLHRVGAHLLTLDQTRSGGRSPATRLRHSRSQEKGSRQQKLCQETSLPAKGHFVFNISLC